MKVKIWKKNTVETATRKEGVAILMSDKLDFRQKLLLTTKKDTL